MIKKSTPLLANSQLNYSTRHGIPNLVSEDRLVSLLIEILIDFIGKNLYDPLVSSTFQKSHFFSMFSYDKRAI